MLLRRLMPPHVICVGGACILAPHVHPALMISVNCTTLSEYAQEAELYFTWSQGEHWD